MPKATRTTSVLLQSLCSEFLFDQSMQMRSDGWMIETLDDFVQKAGD